MAILGIRAAHIKSYLPDLPNDCAIVIVPSRVRRQRIFIQSATLPRAPRPLRLYRQDYSKPLAPKIDRDRWGNKTISRPSQLKPSKPLKPTRKPNTLPYEEDPDEYAERVEFLESITPNITEDDDLDEKFIQEKAELIKSGTLPTILIGKGGGSVYPHPNIVVAEKEKSRPFTKLEIRVDTNSVKVATDQYQVKKPAEFYREVVIQHIREWDYIEVETLSDPAETQKPTSKRFPGLDLDALSPEQRVKLLMTK